MKFPVILRSSDKISGDNNDYFINFQLPSSIPNYRYFKISVRGFVMGYRTYIGNGISENDVDNHELIGYAAKYIEININMRPILGYDTYYNGSNTTLVAFATVQDTSLEKCVFRLAPYNHEYVISAQHQGTLQIVMFDDLGEELLDEGKWIADAYDNTGALTGAPGYTYGYDTGGGVYENYNPSVPQDHIIILEFEGLNELT